MDRLQQAVQNGQTIVQNRVINPFMDAKAASWDTLQRVLKIGPYRPVPPPFDQNQIFGPGVDLSQADAYVTPYGWPIPRSQEEYLEIMRQIRQGAQPPPMDAFQALYATKGRRPPKSARTQP